MTNGRPISVSASQMKPRRIPRPVVILSILWFVLILCAASDAAIEFTCFLVLFFGGLLWGLVWLVRFIVFLVRQSRGSIPRPPFRRALFYWGFEPTFLVLSLLIAVSGLLCFIRFSLCRTALDSYVAEVVAGRVQEQQFGAPKRWVGLFRIRETELLPDGVVRIITASDFLDDAGFTYSPVSPPPIIGEDVYKHMSGAWYHWHRSW